MTKLFNTKKALTKVLVPNKSRYYFNHSKLYYIRINNFNVIRGNIYIYIFTILNYAYFCRCLFVARRFQNKKHFKLALLGVCFKRGDIF